MEMELSGPSQNVQSKDEFAQEELEKVNNLSRIHKSDKKIKKGFRAFNLSENLLTSIFKFGYKYPTPIQRKVIPEVLGGFNVIAKSRTGSGKTASFLIPILQSLKEHSSIVGCRCLILSPSRELANQTLDFCKKFGKETGLKYALLVGGNELEGQFEKLAMNPDIIIATPGRVFHHLNEGSLSLKKCKILVFDEADKLFESGYEDQINFILKSCNITRQVLLFSATLTNQLSNFIKTGIRDYKLIMLDEESRIPEKLKIHMLYCRTDEKRFALLTLLRFVIDKNESTLVFSPTKQHCEMLSEFLNCHDIRSVTIYGQMDQESRTINIDKFRKKKVNILIVTDLAARGLDIPSLDNVINFDFPDKPKLFIHRVGRTARAGRDGRVFSLISSIEMGYYFDLKVFLGKDIITKYETKEDIQRGLNDCNVITFGVIPNKLITLAANTKAGEINHKSDIEYLEESANKAFGKYLRFKQKPSLFGIKQAKEFKIIETHPLFLKEDAVNLENREVHNFMQSLKKFKPKSTIFDLHEVESKQELLRNFHNKAEYHRKKKEREKEIDDTIENNRKDENKRNPDRFEDDKEDCENKTDLLKNKRKRSKIRNFKENPHYVLEKSVPSTNLWGSERPLNLEELTVNIIPDDQSSKKQKFVWDTKKKNFTYAKLDEGGQIIRKNEAGAKIKGKDKFQAYNNWKKKTKLKVQRVGEEESSKIVNNAFDNFKERRYLKRTKQRKPGLSNKNNEIKNYDQLVKNKKKDYIKKNRTKSFRKETKTNKIKNAIHKNRKSQQLVRKRGK